jgi:hypothetical protein
MVKMTAKRPKVQGIHSTEDAARDEKKQAGEEHKLNFKISTTANHVPRGDVIKNNVSALPLIQRIAGSFDRGQAWSGNLRVLESRQ